MTEPLLLNFIGNIHNKFNNELADYLQAHSLNVISFIDQTDVISIEEIKKIKNPILLFPVTNDLNYLDYASIAWKLMIESAFYDWLNYGTSIFIVSPGDTGTMPNDISKIILEIDTESLVDNIWIWPDYSKDLIYRDNSIENLPYQRLISI